MRFRILGITPFKYNNASRYYHFFYFLAHRHKIVEVLNSILPFPYRVQNAIRNFCPNRSKRSQKLHKNIWSFIKKSQLCECEIRKLKDDIDIIFQIGCLSSPYIGHILKPYYVYIDSTMRMAEREYPIWAPFDSIKERDSWISLEKNVYRNAKRVFTMSEYTKNVLTRDYGINESRVKTVYAGLNRYEVPEFDKKYDKRIILFVGRNFERKGGFTILRALKEVKKQIKDVTLIIVGCKPEVDAPSVIVKSFVKRGELLSLYRDASVFVMPSMYEPFGLAFLEAMAHKMPCIGSTKNAMPEIIKENETGFLIPPGDYKALVDRVVFLFRNEDVMKKMGRKGWSRVKEMFTWDRVVSRMTNQFEKDLGVI